MTTLALCGAGMIAGAHAAAAHQLGIPVVAVASRSHERAAAAAKQFGGQPVSYVDLPGGASIVAVATPPMCHAADALRMLEAGALVLLEKPLCRTLDEADQLVEASLRHPGRLLYAENLSYAPVVQRMVAMAPKVGELTHLEVRTIQSLPTWGDFTSDEWGGGALFDLGVHPLAVAMLLANAAGQGRPTSVTARMRGGEGHSSDEHAEVTLHFQSGFTARVVSSWQGAPEPVWDIQLAGEQGVLRADLMPTPTLEWNGDEVALARVEGPLAALHHFGYVQQLEALLTDAARGHQPVMSAAFGREVLQVVLASYASAGSGATESLPFTGRRDQTPLQLWQGVR